VHPWNVGDGEMHVRQPIATPEPSPQLLDGIAAYFETLFALAAVDAVDDDYDIRDKLQSAVTIFERWSPGPTSRDPRGGRSALRSAAPPPSPCWPAGRHTSRRRRRRSSARESLASGGRWTTTCAPPTGCGRSSTA
jgi:hypothetical protein